jgi:hypothetical protein
LQTVHAADKPVIAGVVFQQDIYMKTVLAGMRAAAKEGGAELLEANSDNKVEKEAQILTPLSPAALMPSSSPPCTPATRWRPWSAPVPKALR